MQYKAVVAAAVSAAVLSLVGCGADVKHGTITSKEFEPAQTSVYMQPVYSQRCVTRISYVRTSTGGSRPVSSRSCTSYVSGHVPIVEHTAACYKLDLKNGKGDTGSVCVSEAAWNGAKVGGLW